MSKLGLFLTVCCALFAAQALGSEASADGSTTQRVQRIPPIPPQVASVAIDPTNFDPSGADEQIKQIKKKLEEIELKLTGIYGSHDEKTRITQLRDVLRDLVQSKLTLTSIDGSLSQLRDAEVREAAIARQILGTRSNLFNFDTDTPSNVGPNTPTDRIQQKLTADINESDYVRGQIEQERKLLRVLGGSHSDRLQLLGNQADDFVEKTTQDKIDVIRDQVRSILGLPQIGADEKSSLPSPTLAQPARPTPVPSATEPGTEPITAPKERSTDATARNQQDGNDVKPDDKVEMLVDAVLRLNRFMRRAGSLRDQIDSEQSLWDDRKRVEDYRQVDRNIANLRDQISQIQAKIASLQDAINQAIDTAVNQIGGHEWFTQLATWIFGAAVVIVIGSFFGLAFRDKENRLLSNPDIGLQFVTLFAIIIAIILFGILNILGSKELSALLGGISGYILGRGTLGSDGRRSDSRPCAGHRHPAEEPVPGERHSNEVQPGEATPGRGP